MTIVDRSTLSRAFGIGAIPVVVVAAIELVSTRGLPGGPPIALWAFLWLLSAAVVVAVGWLVRSSPSRSLLAALATGLLLGGLVIVWVVVIADQAPCFVGVPNCD